MVGTVEESSHQSWVAVCHEWSGSGLSMKDFCAQRGIHYKAFMNWRSRHKDVVARTPAPVAQRRSRKLQPQLIPISVEAGDPVHSSKQENSRITPSASSPITIITPAGLRLHVEDDFNEQTLLRVLKTLKEAA